MTPEALAEELADSILDPEACRAAAARIPGRPDSDPVGCCEVAFAGIATLEHVIAETHGGPVAARMNAAVDAALARTFGGAHTPETEAHYGPRILADAAADAVAQYLGPAYWSRKLAETVAARLGVKGASGAALASLAEVFNDITNRAALAISRSGSG